MSVFVHGQLQASSLFIHEINRQLSSQSKGMSAFVHGQYSCFHLHQQKQRYRGVQVCDAKLYLVSLNDVTLFSPLSINMFSQSGSINMLFTFFFNQTSSITMLLTDPCSYYLRSQFLAVTLRIPIAIYIQVKGTAGPSPLHALCRRCSGVTTCPAVSTNAFAAVIVGLMFNQLDIFSGCWEGWAFTRVI